MNKFKQILIEKKDWIGYVYLLPLLFLIICFIFVPILNSFNSSLVIYPNKHNLTITSKGFDNYLDVLSDKQFYHAVKNSTLVLILGTALSFFIAFVISLSLESLISKMTSNLLLTLIYSQFYISSFAVGTAFIYLFGEKNIFFKAFGSDFSFYFGKSNIFWYYVIFQIWRSLPFNIVLFSASINKANIKYKRVMTIDNLSLFNKIKDIYLKEINKTIFVVICTNFIFAFLMYPYIVLDEHFPIESRNGHTVASYILKYLGIPKGEYWNKEKAFAASFSVLVFVFLNLIILHLLRPKFWKKLIQLIKHTKGEKNV
ncbi:carbohydrate ABC transporter permease [Mycoplasma phocoenae]|uniref:Sugar ABC transporter permease n=1 Tax=Mycoplasma phocoenae TaxID=754517 RepID=A0A858U4Q2_9MOLU|nr:sugar ABC transporter permease [Mycoplasma phocoenae]QJG67059.1 sugar ABC transporter permease [Mycoplasma phocoenae]